MSIEGHRVCLVPMDEPDRTERCLTAGVNLNEGEVVGQELAWYSTRVGRCVEVTQVADGPWGRVVGETQCPPGREGGTLLAPSSGQPDSARPPLQGGPQP